MLVYAWVSSQPKDERKRSESTDSDHSVTGIVSRMATLTLSGEKSGRFAQRMPGFIQREVYEGNVQFMHRCHLFSPAYFDFLDRLLATQMATPKEDCGAVIRLSLAFFFNTYLHLAKDVRSKMNCNLSRRLCDVLRVRPECAAIALREFTTNETWLRSHLILCQDAFVR